MLNPKKMPPKPKELFIYVNGEWLPNSQAKISVMDHGLLYGDGCFDAWMGMNGFIYQLDPASGSTLPLGAYPTARPSNVEERDAYTNH